MANEKKGLPFVVFVGTTFMGSIAGAVTGLLLAPRSGKKTREQIRESYDKAVKHINEFVDKSEETLPELISKVKDSQEELKNRILQFKKDTEEELFKISEKGKTLGF